MSFAVFVTFEIDPVHFSEFVARVRRQAADSLHNEPHCHVFDVWLSDKAPNSVQLYEIYEDAAAFEIHLASAHFLAFDTEVRDWVSNKSVSTWDRLLAD